MLSAFSYFPSAIYREERPEWAASTLAACEPYAVEARGWGDLPRTFPVLQTRNMQDDPALSGLATHVRDTAINILREQRYLVERYAFWVSGMWLQEIGTYGGQPTHVHKTGQICALYFLETPESGSYPIFEDPRPGKLMSELDAEISPDEVYYGNNQVHFPNVQSGTILYSNSWLPHRIHLNGSDEHTKLIHFVVSAADRNNACNM